jgi:hypothetical protein
MKRTFAVILLTLYLGACAPAQTPASQAVEDYLQVLSDKDEQSLLTRICPGYEFDALVEFDALAQVQTELKDVACQQVESNADGAKVTCTGSIVSNYGSEIFKYDLGGRTYNVVPDGENWLVCGYTQ